MDKDQIVERVKEAVQEQLDTLLYPSATDDGSAFVDDIAQAAIAAHKAALADAGIVLVPREPTGQMIDAGANSYGISNGYAGPLPSRVLDGQPSKTWRAMLAVAPDRA